MSKIRSAWEIALEKTEDIVIDKEKMAYDEDVKKVRALAGAYLNDDEPANEVIQKIEALEKNKALHEGLKTTIIQNLNLPQESVLTDRFERLESLARLISNNTEALQLLSQVIGFLKQYPEHKKQLIEQLKQQFAPMMQQQDGEMAGFGGNIESNPEFLKIAQQQLEKLLKQYTDTLEDAKNQLREIL
ncbi:MAG: hypothetical protein K6G51_04580 [Sphaerochaetaceae bacterium]|nr:hypothetical protein [Sphaerochaetaceae bacterium]